MKKSAVRRIIIGLLVLLGILGGWFVVVLLIHPWTAVKVIVVQQDFAHSSSEMPYFLRVGCYNIAHGRGGKPGANNWDGGSPQEQLSRLTQIGHLLQTLNLDIVILNEVDFASVWSGHINQARVIAREAGYSYLIEQRNVDLAIPFISLRFGNAILSKYPLSDATLLNYPNVSTLSKLASDGLKKGVICTVHLPDHSEIRVVAVHLTVNSEHVRVASIKMILEHQRHSPLPFLLMGDFNTAPRGYPQYYTDEKGANSIELLLAGNHFTTELPDLPPDTEDLTFPSKTPDCVIDWIFTSPPWNIQQYSVISSTLSDHLPVIAVLSREDAL